MIPDAKSTTETGTDFYDRGLTSRRYTLVGIAGSSIISCFCIIAGIVIMGSNKEGNGAAQMTLSSNLQKEMLVLMINLIVTLCTESIGFMHGISLRSALASESRLRFNSNLRLLTAARGWSNPNGSLLNGIMAVLLIISYNSASLVIITLNYGTHWSTGETSVSITGLPLLLLGVALLLQTVIALSGMRAVQILTWSSSPFDLTAALVHHTQLTLVPFRCMRGVSDLDAEGGPARPSEAQPSAWRAHPSIRKVIISLWGLVIACAGYAVLIMYIWHKFDGGMESTPVLTMKSWLFFPSEQSNAVVYYLPFWGWWWILFFVNLAFVQGPITLGLHCSELIANVIRDERQWTCATGREGLRTATNPLKPIFANPLNLVLLVTKPALHWMFGLSFTLFGTAGPRTLETVSIFMFTAQIWNLCMALFIFACLFTLVALFRPRGPQPAAYGHLQTLANLVDEWSPVMWWGHKEDGISYCHAGRMPVWSRGCCIDTFKQGPVTTRCRL
ncbi:uncharacterized protein EDB91DRAFT_1053706 [Suillus paluster]|uniref:uncharacterized protein n=1 Tax=Suillus paluster TaxID=48578 RepID=UPI001B882A46|nr:uncharacterized protein EDB91DRAFT_1053706 [Suillus paluster]KAG1739861.1 hypothetical protein EDB91DRAFT_1053706 [Suillus paluster]